MSVLMRISGRKLPSFHMQDGSKSAKLRWNGMEAYIVGNPCCAATAILKMAVVRIVCVLNLQIEIVNL